MSPARLIDAATQLTLTSADTPEHQERLSKVSPAIRRSLATYILFGNRPE